jgi:ATP-dependent DNA helicase RecG
MYNEKELNKILDRLISMTHETEVVEFKRAENTFSDTDLGKYFSALSNEANLKGLEKAWLVFGVDNDTHNLTDTHYKTSRASLDDVKKKIADQTTSRLTFDEIYAFEREGKRVVMFEIPAAPRGIPIAYQGHYYGRDGSSIVALNIHEIETIRKQAIQEDWSRQIVEEADITDLDPNAITRARELYTSAHADKKEEIEQWDDKVFLNKAKLTIKDKITRTAILLLGKPESEALISPSVAQIKWILKDNNGVERDYEIFTCPFIEAVDKVYAKIRKLKYRYINTEFDTLFPEELDTYEPYVIREAINNAIAHQDYTLSGQINVVEYEDHLVFTNKGAFLPGNIENVLLNNAPEEHYRNHFLCNAMVGLKMVDTIGSGIRKMYNFQRKRLFPVPLYQISDDRVSVTITGKIIDTNYARILVRNPHLSLVEIELLNRIQMQRELNNEEVTYLRKKHLVEGRKPNLYLSKGVAQTTGQKVAYSKHKGLNSKACEDLLLESLHDHKSLTKEEIVNLLWKVLPDVLSDAQKSNKVNNMLTKLRQKNKIYCISRGRKSIWYLANN